MKTKRYLISKEGCPTLIGYLFPDNVMFWESKGYTCTYSPN